MAELAIDLQFKKRRDPNRRRFLSRAVRDRNVSAGQPWWQPSRASARFSRPRAADLESDLRDELVEEEAMQTEPQILAYSDCATEYEDARRTEDILESEEELAAVEAENCRWMKAFEASLSAGSLRRLQRAGRNPDFYLAERIQDLDAEISNFGIAAFLEENDLVVYEGLAA